MNDDEFDVTKGPTPPVVSPVHPSNPAGLGDGKRTFAPRVGKGSSTAPRRPAARPAEPKIFTLSPDMDGGAAKALLDVMEYAPDAVKTLPLFNKLRIILQKCEAEQMLDNDERGLLGNINGLLYPEPSPSAAVDPVVAYSASLLGDWASDFVKAAHMRDVGHWGAITRA